MSLTPLATLLIMGILSQPAISQDFSCPKPLAIPDAWDDLDGDDEYDANEPYDPLTTGYGADDVGMPLTLACNLSTIAPSIGAMSPVDFPAVNRGDPITGEAAFGQWLVECPPFELAINDSLLREPGCHQDTLIAAFMSFFNQDPGAYWDTDTESVQGSQFTESPRVVTLLAYDPEAFELTGSATLTLAKFLNLFVESIGPGTQINGRIVDAGTVVTPTFPTTWGTLKSRY